MNNTLLIIIAIIGIILLIVGGIGSAIHFLLWIGGVILVIAIVLFIVRALTGSRR